MKLWKIARAILFLLVFDIVVAPSYSQQPDTIYFNAAWQICEKPLAQYYRFGRVVIDTFWFYKGKVQDFYLSDAMQMDGNYSDIGYKEGKFYFFYSDKVIMSTGSYKNNLRTGIWEYYYPDGSLQAKIRFTEDGNEFVVLDYMNPKGVAETKDSSGNFSLLLSPGDIYPTYRVTGEFKKGKKTGTWEYHIENFNFGLSLREQFKDGQFQKGTAFKHLGGVYETYKKQKYTWMIQEYDKFKVTESFKKDRTSFRHIKDDADLRDYLVSGKEPEFELDTSFFNSYSGVLSTLNTRSIIKHFNNREKIYSGEAIFLLTDSGAVRDIEIYGNLSEEERTLMLFFLKKFKTFKEIAKNGEELNAEHKIYFFTAFAKDVLPISVRAGTADRQFFFSPWPYKAFADRVKTILKKSLKN